MSKSFFIRKSKNVKSVQIAFLTKLLCYYHTFFTLKQSCL